MEEEPRTFPGQGALDQASATSVCLAQILAGRSGDDDEVELVAIRRTLHGLPHPSVAKDHPADHHVVNLLHVGQLDDGGIVPLNHRLGCTVLLRGERSNDVVLLSQSVYGHPPAADPIEQRYQNDGFAPLDEPGLLYRLVQWDGLGNVLASGPAVRGCLPPWGSCCCFPTFLSRQRNFQEVLIAPLVVMHTGIRSPFRLAVANLPNRVLLLDPARRSGVEVGKLDSLPYLHGAGIGQDRMGEALLSWCEGP